MSLLHLERVSLSKFSNIHSALRFSLFIPPSNSIYWQVFIVKKMIEENNKNNLNITSESVLNSQKEILNFDQKKNVTSRSSMLILLLMVQMSLPYSYVIKERKFPFPERHFTCFSLLELAQTKEQAIEHSTITV